MVKRRSRLLSLVLTVDLIALTGCGQAPMTAPASAPARHVPVATAATLEAPPAAPAPLVTVSHGSAPAQAAPAIAPVSTEEPATLFREAYSEAAAQATPADAELTHQMQAEMSVGTGLFDWSKLGAIGGGVAGLGFFGYMAYAGKVGSHDLMFPEKTDFHTDPSAYHLSYQKVTFHSHDGLTLVGWYIPASVPTTKGIVLFHGHGSNKDKMLDKYGVWLHPSYNLFLYDSRYHGESEGKFTTLGYFERKDAQIAIDQLKARGNDSVGLLGESMGGAVAIEAAAADKTVKAVWSDCPFDSLQDAIAPRAKKRGYPLPTAVGVAVTTAVTLRAHAHVTEADPIKFVAQIAPRPLYLVHGQADDDTTPINSEKLFEKAKGPKELWRTEGAHHAESVVKYPAEYQTRALKFFQQSL